METVITPVLDWLQDWSSVISGLGSLVLTAGLVYLYKRQHNIQIKQTELIENQQRPILRIEEGVIEHFSHRDHSTSWIVSSFVVGDCDNETKAQREKDLYSRMDAASGVRSPEATVLH